MSLVRGVLVESEDEKGNQIYSHSGLLFKEKYVLITANILMPYLKSTFKNLHEWLTDIQPGKIHFRPFSLFLKQPNLNVCKKENSQFVFRKAEVFASFVCKNILKSSHKYLKDWAVDNNDQLFRSKQFLSLFFILKLVNDDKKFDYDSDEPKEVRSALKELLQNASNWHPEIGDEIFIESTPFGNRSFLNSYSQGIISNMSGEDSCFLLSDCPSTPGSEGCPVFIKMKSNRMTYPVGVVISSLNWWKGEWVGLTLCANLVPLLSQFLPVSTQVILKGFSQHEMSIERDLLIACTNSLVQVCSGTSWGTGILLDKEKGIFLTNSHVITNDTNLSFQWKNQQTQCKLVYKTPSADIYDLAVLQADGNALRDLNITPVKISSKPANVGEEVFSAGFSIFPKELSPKPTLTRGFISQTHKSVIKTTCTVLPGSSGGGIFRPNGELISVIVSNIIMNETEVVYPRINLTIPILAVYGVIEEFLKTDAVEVLQKLQTDDMDIRKRWLHAFGKL